LIKVAAPERLPAVLEAPANAPKYHGMTIFLYASKGVPRCGFSMYAGHLGVSVRATSSENSTATPSRKTEWPEELARDSAHERNRDDTAQIVSVVATTARPTRIAASIGGRFRFLAETQVPHDVLDSTIACRRGCRPRASAASIVKMFSVKAERVDGPERPG